MKMFKTANKVFSFVLAFAVLAVSLFTGVAVINAEAACTVEKIVYAVNNGTPGVDAWNNPDGRFMDVAGGTNVGTGTEDDPFILSTPGHFRYLAQKATYADTHGKYFAVDPTIDVMVFQYESWVNNNGGIDALLALDSGAEVQKFFEDIINGANGESGMVQHQSLTTISGEYFGGHLDGNGVQIVGMYNKSCALFGNISEDATITNITVSNSYIKTGGFASALVGCASTSKPYTATGLSNDNCPGVVAFENIVIKNNYIASTGNNGRVAVLLAGSGTYIGLKMDNCLVYGNKAEGIVDPTNPIPAALFGEVSSGHAGDNAGYPNGSYSNSIILGCVPYSAVQKNQPFKAQYYTNIYTDQLEASYTPSAWYTWDKYDITTIDAANAIGAAAVTTMPKLDWANTWVASADGYPELRALHNITVVDDGDNGHIVKCADCGLEAGDAVAHNYDENYYCSECDYQHTHDANKLTTVEYEGDCINDPGKYITCVCGWEDVIPTGKAPGHKLIAYNEDPSDCLETGKKAHWICEECNNIFLTDDTMASMESAVTEEDLVIDIGGHTQETDTEGKVIIYNNETGHWYECSVCDGKLDHDSGEIEEVIKHDFKDSVCTECGWACTEHDYQPTGNVVVMGTCFVDHQEETKCTICGAKSVAVTPAAHKIVKVDEVAPNDKLEGTKAHYQCEACKAIFADAEGKTSVTRASLVIPKTLPDGYGTVAPENVDTGTKSPATSDNIMATAVAVAALVGAAFVIVRKAVKA